MDSGEPPIPVLKDWYFRPTIPRSLDDYLCSIKDLRGYQEKYQNYWLSSRSRTTDGFQVDGVIMPVCANVACDDDHSIYSGTHQYFNVLIHDRSAN